MSLEGSIKDFGIADILQLINLQKKSGMLTVQNEEESVTINFYNGEIVYALSVKMGENEKIGRLLISSGKLTEKELEDALLVQENTGEKIGHILVASGNISKEVLQNVLQIQIKDVIFKLFRWKDGRYKFDAHQIEFEKEYQIPISTGFILMEGIRMLDEWPDIEGLIPTDNIIFSQSNKGEESEKLFSSLGTEEINIFNLVDGQRDVKSIIQMVNLTEFEVYKTLAALKFAGLISETSLSYAPGIQKVEEVPDVHPSNEIWEGTTPVPSQFADEYLMSEALTKDDENERDKNVPPIVDTYVDRPGDKYGDSRGFLTPPEGFSDETLEKGRLWTVFQVAILTFIVSFVYSLFPIGEMGGINNFVAAVDTLKKISAEKDLNYLRVAIKYHQIVKGTLPSSLEVLYREHFIKEGMIKDPWGNKFIFELLPEGYSLYSSGQDGLPGSGDDIIKH